MTEDSTGICSLVPVAGLCVTHQLSQDHRGVQDTEHSHVYFSGIHYVRITGKHEGVIWAHFEGWTPTSHIFHCKVKITYQILSDSIQFLVCFSFHFHSVQLLTERFVQAQVLQTLRLLQAHPCSLSWVHLPCQDLCSEGRVGTDTALPCTGSHHSCSACALPVLPPKPAGLPWDPVAAKSRI